MARTRSRERPRSGPPEMRLFSIVIPTRNRAHLLQYALATALDQTFGDFEVLVSDNYSSDGTPSVVRDLRDGRVRYVRTDRSQSMPDSWEFAMAHARGEYVTFLCDDDAITARTLEQAKRALERFGSPLVEMVTVVLHETVGLTKYRAIALLTEGPHRLPALVRSSQLSASLPRSASGRKPCGED